MFINSNYPRRIDEQIDEYISPPPISDITDNNGNVILSSNLLLSYLYNTYGNYKSNAPISHLWFMYDAIHHADFLKAWAAWTAEYDPIDNYYGIETNVRQYMDGDETETITHGKTTTNSTGSDGIVTVTQVTTFDSTTPRDDTKTTNTGTTTATDSGATATSKVKTTKNLTVGETTYTADKIVAETNTRHGKLGATTIQKLLTCETEMRLNPLITMYIDAFVSEYCYYITDSWECYE